MAEDLAAIVSGLFERVVKPLVLGGDLRPLETIGPKSAPQVAAMAEQSVSAADTSWLSVARVRRARELCAVDTLPSMSTAEWLLAIVVNDLLYSADPEVNSFLSPHRAEQIIAGVLETLAQAPGPVDLADALARHATFAQVLSVERVDTTISWWCGSATYSGRTPPSRLLVWPSVRRVRKERSVVSLLDMASGKANFQTSYLDAVGALLARTPLTDLATAGRASPEFAWTRPTLLLLRAGAGRTLALRAMRSAGERKVLEAVRAATAKIQPTPPQEVKVLLQAVVDELAAYGSAA